MSRVFVATETALGRRVVVKVVPHDSVGEVSIERFKREIMLAARLQHPHIVPVLSAGESNGLPYFTMPYVEGESLRVRLAKGGELPITEGMRILREVGSALASAHDKGIVHRDIKPDNVLLSGGAAMVTDFGVAKALSASSNAEDGKVTSMGIALGTPAYMSPEQAAASPDIDARADIYAFGVMAYEMFAGRAPFAGRSPQQILAAQVSEAPESVLKLRPSLPPQLAALIMRCLEKHPADRPQTAYDILHALDAITTPSGGTQPTSAAPEVPRTAARRSSPDQPAPTRLTWIAAGAAAALILIAITALTLRRGNTGKGSVAASGANPGKSVAVLPFVNVGGDTTNEYFADGLTDDLSAALQRTGQVRVAARSSAFAFKGKNPQPADVAKRLNVGTVVEGSVQRAGGRIKVRASLINAADGLSLWSDTYERDAKDVFAVQADLSQAIASALRVTLTGEQLARSIGTRNPEAHDLVQRGRYQNDVYTEASLRQALVLFNKAIQLDPNYAEAWSGIAESWGRLADDFIAPKEAIPHIREAVARALALDSLSADAHGQRGALLGVYDWKVPEAERELIRALQLDSANTNASLVYTWVLAALRRPDTAAAVMRRAMRLDPLSLRLARDAPVFLASLGKMQEARAACARSIEIDPRFRSCEVTLAVREGRGADYLDSARALARHDTSSLGILARIEASMGRGTDARRDVELYVESQRRRQRYIRGDLIAGTYALIGDKAKALEWIQRDIDANGGGILFLRIAPAFRSLQGDPGFEALAKKAGIP